MGRNSSARTPHPAGWDRKHVLNTIISCLSDILSENGGNVEFVTNIPTEETHLVGSRSVIDSLELIELIISVEKKLREDHTIAVTLSDEQAVVLRRHSFRTVGTLAEYIHSLCISSAYEQCRDA